VGLFKQAQMVGDALGRLGRLRQHGCPRDGSGGRRRSPGSRHDGERCTAPREPYRDATLRALLDSKRVVHLLSRVHTPTDNLATEHQHGEVKREAVFALLEQLGLQRPHVGLRPRVRPGPTACSAHADRVECPGARR
jgi:hypothetical protein